MLGLAQPTNGIERQIENMEVRPILLSVSIVNHGLSFGATPVATGDIRELRVGVSAPPQVVPHYVHFMLVHNRLSHRGCYDLGCYKLRLTSKRVVEQHHEQCYEMDTVQMRRMQCNPSLGYTITSGTTNTNKE